MLKELNKKNKINDYYNFCTKNKIQLFKRRKIQIILNLIIII